MTTFLQNFYVILWGLLAVLCFFIGRKQGAAGYLLSVFFVFMTVWYGLRAFAGLNVFEGVWGYVFRGVLLVFLAVIVAVWYRGRKASSEQQHQENCDCEQCNHKD